MKLTLTRLRMQHNGYRGFSVHLTFGRKALHINIARDDCGTFACECYLYGYFGIFGRELKKWEES